MKQKTQIHTNTNKSTRPWPFTYSDTDVRDQAGVCLTVDEFNECGGEEYFVDTNEDVATSAQESVVDSDEEYFMDNDAQPTTAETTVIGFTVMIYCLIRGLLL